VPRYNRFRELFHLRRVKSFEELAARPEWAPLYHVKNPFAPWNDVRKPPPVSDP